LLSGGFDDEGEVFDGFDEDGGARGEVGDLAAGLEVGLPELAADFDLAVGGEGGAGGGEAADHRLRAEEDFVAAGAEGDPSEAEGDDAEAEAGGDGDGEMDAHLGDGGVDESGEADDEAGDACGGEDSVGGELEFEREQEDGGDEQEDGGVMDGEQVEAEEGEQDEESAECSGNDGAGDVEFEVDEQAADDEQEDGEVGIGEAGEEFFADGGRYGFELRVGEVEGYDGAVEAMDLLAVEDWMRALSSVATCSMRWRLRDSVSL